LKFVSDQLITSLSLRKIVDIINTILLYIRKIKYSFTSTNLKFLYVSL